MFGTAGSRRTVYLADDNPDVTLNSKPQSTPIKENPTYLIYNRISTVIGEGACQTGQDRSGNDNQQTDIPRTTAGEDSQEQDQERINREKPENSKESAIWYEYGCV